MRILSAWLFAFLLASVLVGCGGKQSSSESAEATPVPPEPAAAVPEEPEVEAEAETATAAAGDGQVAATCEALCTTLFNCMVEASGQQPSEEERAQAMAQCPQDCVQEDPAKLEQAQACLDQAGGSCPALFPCLEQIQ